MNATSQRHALMVSALAMSLQGCASVRVDAPGAELDIRPANAASAPVSVADGFYNDAVAAIDRRDYARALDLLQVARERSPNDARVLNAFGVVYDKLGRFDLSARYYAQAQTADPGSTIVAQNQAYSQVLQGEITPVALASATPPPAPAVETRVATIALTDKPTRDLPAFTAPVEAAPKAAAVVSAAPAPRAALPVVTSSPALTVAAAEPLIVRLATMVRQPMVPTPAPQWRPTEVEAAPAVAAQSAPKATAAQQIAKAPLRAALQPAPVVVARAPEPLQLRREAPVRPARLIDSLVKLAQSKPAPVAAPEPAVKAPVSAAVVAKAAAPAPKPAPLIAALRAAAPANTPKRQMARVEAPVRPAAPLAPVSLAATKPAPQFVRVTFAKPATPTPARVAVPAQPRQTAAATPARTPARNGPRPALMGRPVQVVYSGGGKRSADQLRAQLSRRGWTLAVANVRTPAPALTTIRYAPSNERVAQALARSLRIPVKLERCRARCSGVTILVGQKRTLRMAGAPSRGAPRLG